MKIDWNRKYTTIAAYTLIVVAISILFVIIIFKFTGLLSIIGTIIHILMPVIIGLVIAYLLNPIMKFFDRKVFRTLFKNHPRPGLQRALSVACTALVAVLIITGLLAIIIPEIVKSISGIVANAQDYYDNAQAWTQNFLNVNPALERFVSDQLESLETYFNEFLASLQSNLAEIVKQLSSGIFAVIGALKNVVIGFIIAVYLLLGKEMFSAQVKKVLFAFFPARACKRVLRTYHKANTIFAAYISGQLLDAFIVGILCFIGMTILRLPFAVLISVLIAVTNLIPYFGPFIGSIPSALLIFLSDRPIQAVWFLIFIIILQQVDGNLINPRIQGDSMGMPAFWVIFALMVGGGLFGIAGMLIAVPVFAVLYALFRTVVEDRLEKRSLPPATTSYKGSVENLGRPPHEDTNNTD